MRNYVIINGTNSLTIPGLAIRELPAISKTLMRNQKEEIDGRDGDIITELGYSAYDKTMTIGLYGSYDINQIIAFFNQKGTIVFSDEPDKYYNFTILEKIDYDKLVKFRTATIRIHCQPFKYPVSETPVEIEAEYVTAEAEDITLNNTGVAPLEIGLKGNTYQETTTGKNLASLQTSATKTVGGVNFTINNGVININGTTSSNTNFYFDSFRANSGRAVFWVDATGYTDRPSGNSSIVLQQSDDNVTFSTLADINLKSTSTHQSSVTLDSSKYYRIRWYVENSNVYTSATIKVQLEYGNSKTDFEPYTNGVAPNPDFPMPVEVVTGDNTIKVQSKNYVEGVTWTDGKFLNSSNEEVTNAGWAYSDYIDIENIKYYQTGGFTGSSPKTILYDANKQKIASLGLTTANTLYDLSTYNAKYIRLSSALSFKNSNKLYKEQTYEINLGKNLYNKANATVTGYNNQNISLQLSLKPNTTYSYNIVDRTYGAIYLYDSSNTQTRLLGNTSGTHLITFTTASNEVKGNFVFYAQNNVDISTYDFTGVQIEIGQPTTYSPYFTPIELCKISTYQDYLYKSGEDWFIHREIDSKDLTSTNVNMFQLDTATGYNSLLISKSSIGIKSSSWDRDIMICSHFKERTAGQSATAGLFATNQNGNNAYFYLDSTITTLANAKTYMDSLTNSKVYYVLATPTEEQITNAELIEQLEAILNAVSYEDQTNISQENDDMAFILDVSALKKGTDMAIVNNEGNITSKPIIAVKGNGTLGIYLDNTQMFSLNMTSDITIDTENMEAYDPNTLQLRNRQVTGDYSKFALQPGNNTIKVTGDFTSVTISKYKRWL